jgi:hypothetical protein
MAMDIALAPARELGPNRSDRILVDPSRSNARLEVALTGRRRASAKRSSGTDPPMSFRRGAIVSRKAGRLHLVRTANGRPSLAA